jgi:hypothetical protein
LFKFLFIIFLSSLLYSHQLRENYLTLDYNTETKTVQLDLKIETRLFEMNLNIDDNKNHICSYKELYHHKNELLQYIQNRFHLLYKNQPLPFRKPNISFYRYYDQTYMLIHEVYKNIDLNYLTLNYNLFFNYESNHKLLIHLDELRGDYTITKENPSYNFSSYQMMQLERLSIFIVDGFKHILDGLDHLLFILMLLISTRIKYFYHLKQKNKILSLLKLITLFSIAHSITLFISASKLYQPNVMIIESGIALSIFVVALLNFLQKFQHVNYYIVFGFGLLHGFGFANVLHMIEITDTKSFIISLLGFNLGVEFGQLLIITITLPILILLFRNKFYPILVKSISLAAMGISAYWFFTRIGLF